MRVLHSLFIFVFFFSSMLAGKIQHAIDILNKRKSKTQQIDEILNMLNKQINKTDDNN